MLVHLLRSYRQVFNILPGQGLGFTGSKEIAFGLGWILVSEEVFLSIKVWLYSRITQMVNLESQLE